MAQDAETIEKETKKEINDFINTTLKFNEIDMAATREKEEDYYDKLFDDIADESDKALVIDDASQTEGIIDDDYLFDSPDKQQTKNICDYVINDVDQNDVLFEDLSELKQAFEVKDKLVKRLSEKIKKKYQKQS